MDVRLPKLGEGAESGTVVSIMVKEGDTIATGQTILELENEKAVAPIPSSVSGKVTSVRVKEGDKLSVGQVILSVAEGQGAAAQPAPPSAKSPPHASAPAPDAEKVEAGEKEAAVQPAEPKVGEEPAPAPEDVGRSASPSIRINAS